MAQKRIRMVQRDILNDRLRLLYDDGTQGVLEYGEAVSRSKAVSYTHLTLPTT